MTMKEEDNEAVLRRPPVVVPPRRAPFVNVSWSYRVLFLAAAGVGLSAGAPPRAAAQAVLAPLAYAAWYVALLSAPVGARHARAVAVLLASTAALAALGGPAAVVAAAAVAWVVTYGTVRYADFPPLPARHTLTGVLKRAGHFSHYLHPGPRLLAAGAAGAAALCAAQEAAAPGRAAGAAATAAAALLFEGRLWWRGRRTRLLPVDEYSRAVIEEQAAHVGMSAAEFGRVYLGMFGPSPLELPAWRWRACHADGPPCFSHLWVNNSGVNTPPCCAARMADMARTVCEAAREAGLEVWLDGGSLLGARRHRGAWVPWEEDVDLSYLCPDGVPLGPDAPQMRAMRAAVERVGLTWVQGPPPNHYVHVLGLRTPAFPLDAEAARLEAYRHLHLDLMPAVRRGSVVFRNKLAWNPVLRQWGEAPQVWPAAEVVPADSRVEAYGHQFPAPHDVDRYLYTLYGNWEVVSQTFLKQGAPRDGRRQSDRRFLAEVPGLVLEEPRPPGRVMNSSDSDWSD